MLNEPRSDGYYWAKVMKSVAPSDGDLDCTTSHEWEVVSVHWIDTKMKVKTFYGPDVFQVTEWGSRVERLQLTV